MAVRLSPRHFYELQPLGGIQTGDIWRNLPTFGLLKTEHCTGIVITPSCDLEHRKSCTVTYLPVLNFGHWFQHEEFCSQVAAELANMLTGSGGEEAIYGGLITKPLPTVNECVEIIDAFKPKLASETQEKKQNVMRRIISAATHIRVAHASEYQSVDVAQLEDVWGEKNWKGKCDKLLTNSHSTDLHFLPADDHDPAWSAIPKHALVLMRYPLSVPLKLLEVADDVHVHDWPSAVDQLPFPGWLKKLFQSQRPLKTSKLRVEFLSDLLTRYTSLFNRLGSPDFDNDVISGIRSELG